MASIEQSIKTAQEAITETWTAFNAHVELPDGYVATPFSYQIDEPGFRPFRFAKASPKELQAELDRIVEAAADAGVDLGLDNAEALSKLLVQNGLGVDCSNYVFHVQSHIHNKLEIDPYSRTVFRAGDDIRNLHATKPSWQPKNTNDGPREPTTLERRKLAAADWLDVEWLSRIFGKDPAFITGSAHMSNDASSIAVEAESTLPGDLIAFQKAGSGVVSHVGVVEHVSFDNDRTAVAFSHSWHSRDFEAGVRIDQIVVDHSTGTVEKASHDGLIDPRRYSAHHFRRPAALAILYGT